MLEYIIGLTLTFYMLYKTQQKPKLILLTYIILTQLLYATINLPPIIWTVTILTPTITAYTITNKRKNKRDKKENEKT